MTSLKGAWPLVMIAFNLYVMAEAINGGRAAIAATAGVIVGLALAMLIDQVLS